MTRVGKHRFLYTSNFDYLQMSIKTHRTEELPSFDVVICFSSAKQTQGFKNTQPPLFTGQWGALCPRAGQGVWLLAAAGLVMGRPSTGAEAGRACSHLLRPQPSFSVGFVKVQKVQTINSPISQTQ